MDVNSQVRLFDQLDHHIRAPGRRSHASLWILYEVCLSNALQGDSKPGLWESSSKPLVNCLGTGQTQKLEAAALSFNRA